MTVSVSDRAKDFVQRLRNGHNNRGFTNNPSPFTPGALVNEILDKIPDNLSGKIAVLFTVEMAAELHARGAKDVTVITEMPCPETQKMAEFLEYKYMLLRTVEEANMKFDVVIGNPPYQDAAAPTLKLWHKFVRRGFDLLKDKGRLVFITPRSWIERPNSQLSNSIVKDIFSKNQLEWIDLTAQHHFNVGETPCTYSVLKTPKTKQTKLIFSDRVEYVDYVGQKVPLNDLDLIKISIFNKIGSTTQPKLLKSVYCDTGTADSIECMIQNGVISENINSATDVKVFWTASKTEKYYMPLNLIKKGIKVIINRSGYYYQPSIPDKYIKIDCNDEYAIGAGAYGIICSSITEAKNLVSLLTTKLYRWYIDNEKTSGFNTGIAKLPLLDVSKEWNDIEVYDFFGISPDERNFIDNWYS